MTWWKKSFGSKVLFLSPWGGSRNDWVSPPPFFSPPPPGTNFRGFQSSTVKATRQRREKSIEQIMSILEGDDIKRLTKISNGTQGSTAALYTFSDKSLLCVIKQWLLPARFVAFRLKKWTKISGQCLLRRKECLIYAENLDIHSHPFEGCILGRRRGGKEEDGKLTPSAPPTFPLTLRERRKSPGKRKVSSFLIILKAARRHTGSFIESLPAAKTALAKVFVLLRKCHPPSEEKREEG